MHTRQWQSDARDYSSAYANLPVIRVRHHGHLHHQTGCRANEKPAPGTQECDLPAERPASGERGHSVAAFGKLSPRFEKLSATSLFCGNRSHARATGNAELQLGSQMQRKASHTRL